MEEKGKVIDIYVTFKKVGGLVNVMNGNASGIVEYIDEYLKEYKKESERKRGYIDEYAYCTATCCQPDIDRSDDCYIQVYENWGDCKGSLNLGNAIVRVKGTYNIVSRWQNRFLSSLWYDDIEFLDGTLFKVKYKGVWNIFKEIDILQSDFDEGGRCLLDKWYKEIEYNYQLYLFFVKDENNVYGIFNENGKRLNDIWFNSKPFMQDGYIVVQVNNLKNTMSAEGKLLCDTWFEYMCEKQEGFRRIESRRRHNFLKEDGTLLCDVWFSNAGNFCNGFAIVEIDKGRFSFIRRDGKFISLGRYDKVIFDFSEGFAAVEIDGVHYFIDENGKIMEKNKDAGYCIIVSNFHHGMAFVEDRDKKVFLINLQGERVS